MDCCDLTGGQPAWATHQPPLETDNSSAGDRASVRERSRSVDKSYSPVQQQQSCPVPQLPQLSRRPNNPDMSSCIQPHQQQGNHDTYNNTSQYRTQSGCRPSPPHNVNSKQPLQNSGYQSSRGYTEANSGSWGNGRYQNTRGRSQNSSYDACGRGGGSYSNGYGMRAYNTAAGSSWGSTKSDSPVDGYQSGHRGGFRPSGQHQQGGSHNTWHPSDRGVPGRDSTGYLGHSNANRSSRPDYRGRGSYGSASAGGGMYRSGSGGVRFGNGRGSGGFRPGSAGQGSGPPPWVKHGCWLVPRPGSRFEQTIRATEAATAVGSRAGDASVDVHQQQQLLEVLDLTADDGTVELSPAGDGNTTGASGTSSNPKPITSDSDSWIGQGKVVVILRGLPGAGKSTRAAQIVAKAEAAAAGPAASPAADMKSAAAAADLLGAASAAVLDNVGLESSIQTGLESGLQHASVLASAPVQSAVIHSTDSFFVDPATAVYTFNVELLSINHQKNLDAFCVSLAAGVRTIVVDNTNIQPWQFEKYVTAAWVAGYQVREEVVGQFTPAAAAVYAARNVHGVPYDKLLIMLDQWKQQ